MGDDMNENNIVPLNEARAEPRPALTAGHRPQAIVPTDMDSTYRLAVAVVRAGMAPKGLETAEKCMVAMMHGLEVGLTPMAALQRIAVVNGRPTIWGDGAIGLVRASGLCEWVKERIEGDGDARVAICETKRRGEQEAIRRTFSIADAKRAGLWGKGGPWQQYPERMLAMRARAFALRDLFADVLGGLYVREEIEDEAERAPAASRAPAPPAKTDTPAIEHQPAPTIDATPVEVTRAEPAAETPRRAPPPPPKRAPAHVSPAAQDSKPLSERAQGFVGAVQEQFPGATVAETFTDWEAVVKEWEDAAAVSRDVDTLDEAWNEVIGVVTDKMPAPDLSRCDAIYAKRKAALR